MKSQIRERMEYLLGSKEKFWKFVDSIKKEDRIAIVTHNDLDGIASAVFLEEILKSKKIEMDDLFFISYSIDMFQDILPELKNKNITKIFFTDIYVDGMEGFEKVKENFDIFTIDHHPIQNKDEKNIIKTQSSDCSALTIFDLGKEILDWKKWKTFLYATMISEMSYKNPENFEMIKQDYPDLKNDAHLIRDSPPGKISQKITFALIFFKSNLRKLYDLIKNNNMESFDEPYEIINKEIEKWKKDFRENAEYYPEKELYLYYFKPKYKITSIFSTLLSIKEPNKILVIIASFAIIFVPTDNFSNLFVTFLTFPT